MSGGVFNIFLNNIRLINITIGRLGLVFNKS